MVSQSRVFNIVPTSIVVVSLCVSCVSDALAQEPQPNPNAPNQSAAALHSAQSVNTPEKKRKWLREKYQIQLSQKWPVNFPVPAYTSNVVQTNFSNSTDGQPRAAAALMTKDPPARVFDFYQSALSRAKWTVRLPSPKARSAMNLGSDYYFLTAEQGKQTINLTCAGNPKTKMTFVNISWQKSL